MKQLSTALPLIGFLILAACSAPPRNYFVLIPDPEGKVGEISIENDAGKQIVTTAGAVVAVKSKQALPQHRKPLATKEIQANFDEAIKAIPALSTRYILFFKFGIAQLTEQSKRYFNAIDDQIVQVVKERTPCDIRIVGHTDTRGSDALNLKLGLARARRVFQKMRKIGISPDQMEVVSHSEKNLHVPTPDNTAEAKNRRVEILIH